MNCHERLLYVIGINFWPFYCKIGLLFITGINTMARITVDDCLKAIPNRFDMTLAATTRARQLAIGSAPLVEAGRDKATVIALREIAQGKVGLDILNPKNM